jgi:hypothetical protein
VSVTQINPRTAEATPDTAWRALRCLKLVTDKHGTNRCQSRQADGSDLCAHHLAVAVEDYRRIVSEATA